MSPGRWGSPDNEPVCGGTAIWLRVRPVWLIAARTRSLRRGTGCRSGRCDASSRCGSTGGGGRHGSLGISGWSLRRSGGSSTDTACPGCGIFPSLNILLKGIEGNVVVEALDGQGNVLDRQPATLQGSDVGSGGEGTWSTELTIKAEPGTAGEIRAFSPSPQDGSVIAEDRVEVSLGSTPAVESYLKISEPEPGTTLDVTKLVQVSGTGAGLPEGNVVVVAVGQDGDVLAEQPTTLQGTDVGTGGAGTWSVELAVPVSGQAPGYIAAFSTSPKQRDFVATDHVPVTFSGEYTLEGTTWLLDRTIPGSEITALFANGQVSGSAGCNTYQGTYRSTRAAGRNTIEFGPLATTRMMCDEPLMGQEELYLAPLEAATEYTIEGFALSIEYPGGELLFYDKNGWIVRLAYNWRDKFLSGTFDGNGIANPVYTDEYAQLDGIISYTFEDLGLTIFAEGFNLTDEYARSFSRREEQVQYVTKLGPRYGIGARWVF